MVGATGRLTPGDLGDTANEGDSSRHGEDLEASLRAAGHEVQRV